MDEPLISADGQPDTSEVLSFLNLLELRMLSRYRSEAALQAIRRALSFAADQLDEPRPLVAISFKVHGGELFTRFAQTDDGRELLLNASRGGQLTAEQLAATVSEVTEDIDYKDDISWRWWFKSRSIPIFVDTKVAGGHPITAETGVRVDAIASRHHDGFSTAEIEHDTGASQTEIVAAILAA
jgi:uncharacterized protein (DUF433 family)